MATDDRAEGALEACAREIVKLLCWPMAEMDVQDTLSIMRRHGLRGPELWYPCCGYSVQGGHHPDCADPLPPHAGIRARTTEEGEHG